MSDITKQPANNISATEEKSPATEGEKQQKGLGGYTKRNFRPGQGPTSGFNQQRRRFYVRGKKICHFCASGVLKIDYKNKDLLEKYLNPYAKILSRRQTGNCSMHQRHLSNAIKRARVVALVPFIRD